MAEIFGPIGFAFGAIGFIFSTAGTVTEAWENFHHYEEHMGLYQVRLGNFERKINKWNILWRDVKFDGSEIATINGIKRRTEKLLADIEKELRSHNLTDQGFWSMLKAGRRLKMKDIKQGFMSVPHGLAYALWQKKKLESWILRLQNEVIEIDTLSKNAIQKRTANFASDNPDQGEIERTTNLEHFVKTLHDFAQRIHEQCTSTPTTRGWALGLRPPRSSHDNVQEIKRCARDVKSWRDIAQVDIELVYSLEGQTVREGRLRLGHHRRHEQSPALSHDMIQGEIATNDPKIKHSILDEPRIRTRPLGKLIQENFFKDIEVSKAWRQDRARLIRGISNWTLFLWGTNWTQELCCYGLQFEKEVSDQDCFRQLFTAGLHEDQCLHHPWRLRNLGLVLAQLVLATSFRCTGDLQGLEFEEWVDQAWSRIYKEDIMQRLLDRLNTDKIRDAIDFCFTDGSPLARDPFKPGFLFKCIEAIHNKITEWCDVELSDKSFYDELNEGSTNHQWPKDAYELPQQPAPNVQPADNGQVPPHFPHPNDTRPPDNAYQLNDPHSNLHEQPPPAMPNAPKIEDNNLDMDDLQHDLSIRPTLSAKKRWREEEIEPEAGKRVKTALLK